MARCWALAGGPRGSVPSASRRRCWGRSEHADRSAEPMGPKMWRVTVNDWERHKETQRRKMRASYNNNEETWQINKSQQSPLILRKFTGIKWGRLWFAGKQPTYMSSSHTHAHVLTYRISLILLFPDVLLWIFYTVSTKSKYKRTSDRLGYFLYCAELKVKNCY